MFLIVIKSLVDKTTQLMCFSNCRTSFSSCQTCSIDHSCLNPCLWFSDPFIGFYLLCIVLGLLLSLLICLVNHPLPTTLRLAQTPYSKARFPPACNNFTFRKASHFPFNQFYWHHFLFDQYILFFLQTVQSEHVQHYFQFREPQGCKLPFSSLFHPLTV